MKNYEDIINLKRPTSVRPKVPLSTRAAQFAPFSALTGYSEVLEEIRRITTKRRFLTDGRKEVINEKLKIIKKNIRKDFEIEIIYFVVDTKKTGGKYLKVRDKVRRIDEANKEVILMNGKHIFIDDIEDIFGDVFNSFEM